MGHPHDAHDLLRDDRDAVCLRRPGAFPRSYAVFMNSPRSDEAVGGLIFDFERILGGVIDMYHTQVRAGLRERRRLDEELRPVPEQIHGVVYYELDGQLAVHRRYRV